MVAISKLIYLKSKYPTKSGQDLKREKLKRALNIFAEICPDSMSASKHPEEGKNKK
jgi:hypothetical protein